MKLVFIIACFFPFLLNAQLDSTSRNRIETSLKYSLQCPIYSVNTPTDLALSQDTRYRSRISAGIKYYPFKRWYAEYLMSFSQEGGGYIKQRTNADYFKNSILLGYSSLHSNRIIIDIICGVDINLLLNAKLITIPTNNSESVSEYYNKVHFSFPIGLGLKTKIIKDYYLSCHTFLSFSPYSIGKESYIRTSQIIFPAFQLGLSKFLK